MQELKLLALVSSVGLAMVLSVAFGVLLGLWLDRRLGTKPWLFFAGLAVGVAAAFKNFVVMTRRMERQRSEVYGKGKPPGGE
jgi:F0F1-type ATP synthase assembly protein I